MQLAVLNNNTIWSDKMAVHGDGNVQCFACFCWRLEAGLLEHAYATVLFQSAL